MTMRKFHLYLLIGQSNMAGRGALVDADPQPHPRVLMLNQARQWTPAVDPIHFDKPAMLGVGPGRSFGQAMAERDPTVRIGLIPGAAGGSPITSWTRGGFWRQTGSHPLDDALARARIGQQDGLLKGILWHHGESDSNETDAPLYQDRLTQLIATLRAELGIADLPFVAATLGDFYLRNEWAAKINKVLLSLPQRIANTACVDAQGLTHKGDNLHFDTPSAQELGRRYAKAMIELEKNRP